MDPGFGEVDPLYDMDEIDASLAQNMRSMSVTRSGLAGKQILFREASPLC